ncbi:PASTA domain-containing protein [Bifidobacterium stellenboschense]|uniref:PASTA domain protein n=1 Tax=Bifidobacterium stellenboschense TaxID=762211 RepID=A0A087D9H4_9BIFI|nr:PASTA domain-containing protein [Bifidobacterium stellenboschense]KFI92174.1 PASTA domain protein [Bifidobacterium stellenboschense]
MICTRCGAANEGGYRFCAECGAPLPQGDATVTGGVSGSGVPGPVPAAPAVPPVPGPSGASVPPRPSVPMPGAPVPEPASAPLPASVNPADAAATTMLPPVGPGGALPGGDAGSGDGGAQTVAKKNRLPLILAIVVAVLVVVGGIVAFLTYRSEVWGGKTLPDPASVATTVTDAKGKKKASVVKAKDVTEALKAKGLKTKTVPVFSGSDKGVFLGYSGAKQGDRVDAGSTVVVQESAGPGVPKDTVGKNVNKVVDLFAQMGVPIHYKQVVISSDSKTPEGQVSTTYPAPGVGLTDDEMENGIYIGVASKGDGIPVDVMGMDKDKAVSELESQGYDVELEPHYSSKQYVGKISGSYPAPGSSLSSGDSVTLYYGVDKSSNMDLLTKTTGSGDYAMDVVNSNATPMIGMYCKSEVKDASKDCITLEEADGPYGDSAGGGFMQIKGHEPSNDFDALGLNNFSQGTDGVMVSTKGTGGYMKESDLAMANHLLLGKTGAFELYAGMGLPNCGDTVMTANLGEYCRSGSYGRVSNPNDLPSGKNSGETFNMKDFLVYVPVGADVKSLEDSGYFDSKALESAKKQKAVDTSRPFIVMRDPSLYSETKVSADDTSYLKNPFVPTNDKGTNHLVGMKPAPSDSTVYYLVEQNGDLDWDSLPDAKVKQTSTKQDSSDDSGKSSKTDKTLAEAMKAGAAEYGMGSGAGAWGASLTINVDGTFKGSYYDTNMGDTGDDHPNGSRDESSYTGRFKSAKKNGDGTYTLQCDAGAFKIDGKVGTSRIEDGVQVNTVKPVGMDPCGEFTLYPKGYDTSKLSDDQLMFSGGAASTVANSSELPGPALYNTESSDMEYTFFDLGN